MNYILVVTDNLNDLQLSVNQKIKKGYMPLGGILLNKNNNYIQSMIKKNENLSS
jgi:hypothetical protein